MELSARHRRNLRADSRQPCGSSLVEVIAAVALTAGTLVPALELVRQGIELSEQADQRQLLALYAVSEVEQRLASVSVTWATGAYTGDQAADGHASIRYQTICSDSLADGGEPDALMDIRTTVYFDADGDDALDAGELQVAYRTKIGKFASYDAEAE